MKILLMSLLLLVSCGKVETPIDLGQKFENTIENIRNVGIKALDDTIKSSEKAVRDSYSTLEKGVQDAAKTTEIAVQDSAQLIEEVGRVPRDIGNQILGTSEHSDEKVAKNAEDIEAIQDELDFLYEEILYLHDEFDFQVSLLRQEANENHSEVMNRVTLVQAELSAEIQVLKAKFGKRNNRHRKHRAKFRKLRRKVHGLKQDVRSIRRDLNRHINQHP